MVFVWWWIIFSVIAGVVLGVLSVLKGHRPAPPFKQVIDMTMGAFGVTTVCLVFLVILVVAGTFLAAALSVIYMIEWIIKKARS